MRGNPDGITWRRLSEPGAPPVLAVSYGGREVGRVWDTGGMWRAEHKAGCRAVLSPVHVSRWGALDWLRVAAVRSERGAA